MKQPPAKKQGDRIDKYKNLWTRRCWYGGWVMICGTVINNPWTSTDIFLNDGQYRNIGSFVTVRIFEFLTSGGMFKLWGWSERTTRVCTWKMRIFWGGNAIVFVREDLWKWLGMANMSHTADIFLFCHIDIQRHIFMSLIYISL